MAFEDFSVARIEASGVQLSVRVRRHADAHAPALLLLHGFPQTGHIWHKVAGALARLHTLVCPDLRGYGASDKPAGGGDHASYSKRTMAADLVEVMARLGFERFAVVGHDRGGRVAHRLALDHPERVSKLSLIDIAPTLSMYERTDMAFARAYFHWFFLIQPEPLPEMLLSARPIECLHAFLGGRGVRGLGDFQGAALTEYEDAWRDPATIHGACEDYRAAAGIDLEHDRASDAQGRKIECPLQVLWGEHGVIHRLFRPLQDWQDKARRIVEGRALAAGHFIPEEVPEALLRELEPFLGRAATA